MNTDLFRKYINITTESTDTAQEQDMAEGIQHNFNDDDWYEINPETRTIVQQYGPSMYRMPPGQRHIKLPNGNVLMRGMRAKSMDLTYGIKEQDAPVAAKPLPTTPAAPVAAKPLPTTPAAPVAAAPAAVDPVQQKSDQMQQALLDRMGKRFGLPAGSSMEQVQAAQQAHLTKTDPAAAAQYQQNMANIEAGGTHAANTPVQLAPTPAAAAPQQSADWNAGLAAQQAGGSPIAIMMAQPGIAGNQQYLDSIATGMGLPAGSTAAEIMAADAKKPSVKQQGIDSLAADQGYAAGTSVEQMAVDNMAKMAGLPAGMTQDQLMAAYQKKLQAARAQPAAATEGVLDNVRAKMATRQSGPRTPPGQAEPSSTAPARPSRMPAQSEAPRAAWADKVAKQFPGAKIMMSKTPNGPAFAKLNGKTVAEYPEKQAVSERGGRVPKFNPRTGLPMNKQISEFGGDAAEFGTPTQEVPVTDQPPRRGYSIELTGTPGRDYQAIDVWQALAKVLPRDYPPVDRYGDGPAQRATYRVHQQGSAVVKSGINSEDIAETLVSRLAQYVPDQNWRIISADVDEAVEPVPEAKGLHKRVKIVKGPDAGKTGWIRQVEHGQYKGAPKKYDVDIEGGGQANGLPATALRLIKDEQGVAEGIMNTIANKVMGTAPETPKYQVGQRVKYETSPDQPEWKDGGRGVGVITAYKNGHYMINGNPVNHFEIKGVVEQGVAEGVAETMPMDDAVKVLRQYGADHFKTTSNELHFYKNGRPLSVDLIFNDDATRSVSLSQLNSATRSLKGQGVAEGSSSHAELAKMAHAAYVAATRKGNGPMAAHYLKQYQKHKADAAKEKSSVTEGTEQMTPNWAKYVLDQLYNSDGAVTMTDLFDEGIPGLHDMFMDTAREHGLNTDDEFMDVEHEVILKLEDIVKGGHGLDEGAMPPAVIKAKEKIRLMSDSEKKEYFKGKSKEQLQKMARSHGYGENSNVYAKHVSESRQQVRILRGPFDSIGKIGYISESQMPDFAVAEKKFTVEYVNDDGFTRSVRLPAEAVNLIVADVVEARQSAAVKLSRAWDKQKAKSDASKERAKQSAATPKKDEPKKD